MKNELFFTAYGANLIKKPSELSKGIKRKMGALTLEKSFELLREKKT